LSAPAPTLHEVALSAARRLERAGIGRDEATRDAALLARHALGWDQARWIAERRGPVPPGFDAGFTPLVERRRQREPIAYILGAAEFWGLDFEVTPDVLIPRPETELIVEEALRLYGSGAGPARIVDVGTGSGCLAVTLARAWPGAHILATDVSPGALAVARRNAARHGVADRIALVEGALLATARNADLVVSNPPYVNPADADALPPDVRDFEPHLALFADAAGLAVIAALAREAATRLNPGGWLLCEIGQGQWPEVERRFHEAGSWTEVGVARDLQGIARTARARRADRPIPRSPDPPIP
jgi:release factor glutamine methyltransferase